MSRTIALIVAVLLAVATVSSTAAAHQTQQPPKAGMVRGYLYRMTSQGQVPAGGIMLRLRHPQYGLSAPAQTAGGAQRDGGGMYYFYNVWPGEYALDIIVSQKEIYQLTTVRVPINQPVTDVPPIAVR